MAHGHVVEAQEKVNKAIDAEKSRIASIGDEDTKKKETDELKKLERLARQYKEQWTNKWENRYYKK
jgi:hypothetical protein